MYSGVHSIATMCQSLLLYWKVCWYFLVFTRYSIVDIRIPSVVLVSGFVDIIFAIVRPFFHFQAK